MLSLINVLIMVIHMGNRKSFVLLIRVWILKHVLFWSVEIFIPIVWMKLGIFLNGWLVIHISLRSWQYVRDVISLSMWVFVEDYIIRNNLWNLVPFQINPLNMLPLFMILINHFSVIPNFAFMLFPWVLDLSKLSRWKIIEIP